VEKFDGASFDPIATGVVSNLQDVAWRPDGVYGLVVGTGGAVLEYDGSTITPLSPGTRDQLFAVGWRGGGSQALLVGGKLPIFPGEGEEISTVLAYDGASFISLSPDGTGEKALFGLGWKPDGSYALIVGNGGTVLKYQSSAPLLAPAPTPPPAPAVDQDFSPERYNLGQGFGSFDVGQSFIPTASNIVAVDLPICTGSQPDEIEVQIRDATYDGPVLASNTLVLDAPLCSYDNVKVTRIDFGGPAPLVPGQTYIIRLHSVVSSDAGLFGTSVDQYPGGNLFIFDRGQAYPDRDIGFTTYAAPE
jgi:hypothetical protein